MKSLANFAEIALKPQKDRRIIRLKRVIKLRFRLRIGFDRRCGMFGKIVFRYYFRRLYNFLFSDLSSSQLLKIFSISSSSFERFSGSLGPLAVIIFLT